MPYLGKQPNKSATSTIGNGVAEDTMLKFDGNAVDYHIGLDDSADKLTFGKGSTLGTTTSMTFDGDGIMNMPLQPAAYCHLSANQSVNDNTWTKAAMASEEYDQNNDMDLTNYKFVAPVDGLYLCTMTGGYHMDTDKLIGVSIRKNGTEVLRSLQFTGGTNHHQVPLVGILKLDASDYLEWYWLHNFGSADNVTGSKEYSYAMTQLLA